MEVAEEVMLEVPPKWNAVPDLITEDEEGLMIMETDTNWERDEVAPERRKRLEGYLPHDLGEHETQQDSILRTRMSFNKKKMNGRHQINGRGFHRWCFIVNVWR